MKRVKHQEIEDDAPEVVIDVVDQGVDSGALEAEIEGEVETEIEEDLLSAIFLFVKSESSISFLAIVVISF